MLIPVCVCHVCLEAVAIAKFNKIFTGRLQRQGLTLRALAHTHTHTHTHTHIHTHRLLPESDPALVVEFCARTGITAAGGRFDFERCARKMFVCT
jgi:hypothetical protein